MFFFFDFEPYIAIIGDIKKSKEIEDRKGIQNKLTCVLDSINEKYKSVISAKFIITLGDEFQGLLCKGESVLDIIEEIQREMYPIQIRFGIGIGKMTTEIIKEMAIGADGPSYYRAREAMEGIRSDERKKKREPSDIRIEIEKDTNSISLMLNTIFLLMEVIKGNWSERQRTIIYEYEKFAGSQAKCAERLNITQSSVHRSLVKGNYYAYKNAKDTIRSVLREVGERYV